MVYDNEKLAAICGQFSVNNFESEGVAVAFDAVGVDDRRHVSEGGVRIGDIARRAHIKRAVYFAAVKSKENVSVENAVFEVSHGKGGI